MNREQSYNASLITPVLVAGSLILVISFSIRSSFGVFQIPIADEFGWPRADFSMAIAIQNLFWGIGQPIFGAIAERFSDRRAIVLGVLLYTFGLAVSAFATTPAHHFVLEALVGMGIAGTGLGLILAIVGRATSDKHRSMALAIATAAASMGQVIGPPLAEWLLTGLAWQTVFLIFAVAILASLLVMPMLNSPAATKKQMEETMGAVIARAMRDPSYALIFMGFFSCGYQLGFMTAHFPAMVTEMCGPINPAGFLAGIGISTTSALGAVALSIVGLANIGGVLVAGWLGSRFKKKNLLALVYAARTVIAAAFIILPITPLSVIVFAAAMGSLWLATVPLTSGLVGYIYGLRYMGTLYGVVFFSHQLGSFLGIWLGGRLYDATGDYTFVWWIGVAVGAFSAIVHLPIRERPLDERAPAVAG